MRPRLLDLFAGAGGCTRGYQLAGFHVTGVDHEGQPNYCGDEFFQADAVEFPLAGYDVIHASPPCHDHSPVTGRNRKSVGPKGTGWILDEIVRRLQQNGGLWVVENVDAARMPSDSYSVRLCGSSFGLDVRRHRKFATDVALLVPPCVHGLQKPRFRSLDHRQLTPAAVVGVHGHLNYPGEFALRCAAMGIDWMTTAELSQAIPPAYTQFIGEQLLQFVGVQ